MDSDKNYTFSPITNFNDPFTSGIGIELRFLESRNHGFDFDLNFPVRSDDYKND